MILHCTSDVSHYEKLSFTIRFVGEYEGCIQVKEHFIGFKTVDESSGESLTELIMNTMNEYSICIQNCRGQGYDNGANMKGKNKGVQARILAINSRASFVPSGCHSLNLVISDAASSSINSISLFGVIQRLYVLFSASVHRWKILTTHVIELTFKPLCSTRWESRINSVKAVRYQLPELYDTLMEFASHPVPTVEFVMKH